MEARDQRFSRWVFPVGTGAFAIPPRPGDAPAIVVVGPACTRPPSRRAGPPAFSVGGPRTTSWFRLFLVIEKC